MILTKDNLIKFIQEKKYVTPTEVSKTFFTTTLVASAALSQLVDQKIIGVTYLKLGSTPYYYDLNQREVLQELAESHLSKNELLIYKRLKAEKIINDNSLTAIEKLAIKKIRDFAVSLDIDFNNINIKFWVWYLLDLEKTRREILDALKSYKSNSEQYGSASFVKNEQIENPEDIYSFKKNEKDNIDISRNFSKNKSNLRDLKDNSNSYFQDSNSNVSIKSMKNNNVNINRNNKKLNKEEDNKKELIIERFLIDNLFKIEDKENSKNYINYSLIYLNSPFKIKFRGIFFKKKVSEIDILKFYSNSNLPLLVIGEKVSKKIKNLCNKLDNLFVLEL